jgi:hypothetical protein
MAGIPSPETITAQWLTEQLRAGGYPDALVRDFRTTRIGTGQIGLCLRFELELAAGGAEVPRTLVGKFPSDDPTSRATGVQLRNYRKEVAFYQGLKRRLDINTPRCFYAEIVGEGPEFALLLEDLAPAQQGDQLAGCGAEVARAAVLELVGLHAPSWNAGEFLGVDWIGEPDEAGRNQTRALYQALLPGFLSRYGAQLERDEADIIAAVADAQAGPLFSAIGQPFALVHVDYRLDNLLIDQRQHPPAIAVVDWQSITIGRPLSDVAYFLGAGMLPAARRPVEQEIVRAYHDRLRERGVEDYPWACCWEDYRRGSFAGFGVTVIASMLVQQTPRGDEMFTVMARRHSRHALDLGAQEFLQ